MDCRRCGKELPVGKIKTCPHCGIYLETFITPRGPAPKTRRTGSRALIMSFVSITLAVIVMMIVIPFLRNMNKSNALENIEASYIDLSMNRDGFTDEDWEMKLASFVAAVYNFEKLYPAEQAHIDRFRGYVDRLTGGDPDTLTPQEIYDRELIRTARDEIIDILELTASGSGLLVRFQNASNLIIHQLVMVTEGFDADGNSLGEGAVRTDRDAPVRPQTEERVFFIDVWGGAAAADAKIIWINVDFGPSLPAVYIRREVCEVLWP